MLACSAARSAAGGGKRLISALAEKQSQKKLFPFSENFGDTYFTLIDYEKIKLNNFI